ncbi:hypothetical protein SAMN05444008_101274 [Cnuella takakiae]|uniref:Uncharacterized protein n=1 Tax=Cnuella takakiae TaxID=1302690 RepID=A0A1M4SY92_9BACT|nr:hypothetical protein SAMN05444008_101274 [Cnuella takakiae]
MYRCICPGLPFSIPVSVVTDNIKHDYELEAQELPAYGRKDKPRAVGPGLNNRCKTDYQSREVSCFFMFALKASSAAWTVSWKVVR